MLSRGLAVPSETWCQWVNDGSFSFDRDDVLRPFIWRAEEFRPLVQSAEVDRLFLSLKPATAPRLSAKIATGDQPKPSPQTADSGQVDSCRTGVPGRPNASHIVVTEAQRRIDAHEVTPRQGGLQSFADDLAEWWEGERRKQMPEGPPLTPNSIKNAIRSLWNAAKSNSVQNSVQN